MQLIQSLRERRHRKAISALQKFHDSEWDPLAVRRIQLQLFNNVWKIASNRSQYYANLKMGGHVPEQFRSWDEFSETMPLLRRDELKRELKSIAFVNATPDCYRTTGGTSSEPIQLPAWRSEDHVTGINSWLARRWFGATANDRLFLLWGHSHLLGTGASGKINAAKRVLKDSVLGYFRQSAYDLSETALREAGERMLAFRPGYILGYSSALCRFAQFNRDKSRFFKELNLKVAIATGECFPESNSSQMISEVLGCPVVMEYGAVETGIIAHQHPVGQYRVFWNTYYVERLPSLDAGGASEIAITSLYPRLTPLIRYRIGDLVQSGQDDSCALEKFDKVVGRSNDGIIVGRDGFVHSEAFSHIMRDISSVDAFQVVQKSDGSIAINYTADATLLEDVLSLVQRRLSRIDSRLGDVVIRRVDGLETTVSGKSKRIVSALGISRRHAA